MFFGQVGFGELLLIGLVGLIVLGPERLPKYAKDAGRLIRQLRAMAHNATSELRNELGPEFKDLDPRDLNPREMLRRLVEDEPIITQAPAPHHPPLPWATPPADAAPPAPAPVTGSQPHPNGTHPASNGTPTRTGYEDIT